MRHIVFSVTYRDRFGGAAGARAKGMDDIKTIEKWLYNGGTTPPTLALARYIRARAIRDYPGDEERGVPAGKIPAHDWMRRASLALANAILEPHE